MHPRYHLKNKGIFVHRHVSRVEILMALRSLIASVTCRGATAFLVVILGQLISGSYNTLNVTLVAIKEKFNYTQTEVEIVISALPLGLGLAMPAGIILDHWGPKITSVIGLFIIVPGLGFMYLATLKEEFFHDKAWLLAIIVFCVGQGSFVTFIITWTTGARQADPRFRGILFGIFKSILLGSPVFFTLMYDIFFKKGRIPVNQDVGGYILFLLIAFVSVDFLILIFTRDDSIKSKEKDENSPDAASEITDCRNAIQTESGDVEMMLSSDAEEKQGKPECCETAKSNLGSTADVKGECNAENFQAELQRPSLSSNTPKDSPVHNSYESIPDSLSVEQSPSQQHVAGISNQSENNHSSDDEDSPLVPINSQTAINHTSFISLLKDPTYQSLSWALALAITSDSVIYANIEIITLSVNLQAYNTGLMVLSRVIICVTAFLSGVFLNCVPQVTIRYALVIVGIVAVLFANVLFVSTTEHPWILFAGLSILAVGTGILWVVGAGLTFSVFGPKDYGRNWGMVLMMVFVFSLVVSVIVGRMYDAKITILEYGTCIGEHCVRDWFIILGSFSFLSLLLSCVQLVLLCRRISGNSNMPS